MEGCEHIDSIETYLSDIDRFRPIPAKEEHDVIVKAKGGDKVSMDRILNSNLKFVVSIAKNYRGKGVPFDELIAEGNMGLITAIMKYDLSRNCKFITYAVFWIRSNISQAISNATANAKGNRDLYENIKNDSVVYDDNALLLKGVDAKAAVSELSKCLEQRELEMLSMKFGLDGKKSMDFKEIGKRFGVTSECVRQTVNASIRKMKKSAVCSEHFKEFSEITK